MGDDMLKLRIGCGILGLLLCVGPYLWFFSAGGGGGFDGGDDRPPAPGTPEEVLHLQVAKDKVEEALVACRKGIETAKTPETKDAFAKLLPGSLEAVYNAKRGKKAWTECETLIAELQRDHAAAAETKRVLQDWRLGRAAWTTEALEKGDLALAGRLAQEIIADPTWRPVAWDDPYWLWLAKRWHADFDAGDSDAAERDFAPALADPRVRENDRLLREHGEFLHRSCLKAFADGNRVEADRRFDTILEVGEGRSPHVDLRPFAEYLAARMKDLLEPGDFAGAEKFFDRLYGHSDDASKSDRTGAFKPLYTALCEAHCRAATAAGDLAGAERALEGDEKYKFYVDYAVKNRRLAELRMLGWRKEHDEGKKEDARRHLLEVLTEYGDAVDPAALNAAVREEWQPAELVAQGDALLKKDMASGALACFEAAQAMGAADVDPRIDSCLLGSARRTARYAGEIVDFLSYARAEALYERLLDERKSFAADRARWTAAAHELLAAQVDWARHYAENEMFPKAEKKIEQAIRKSAVRIWKAERTDPWAGVPTPVVDRIAKAHPNADAAARLAALEDLAARGVYVVPQAAPAVAMLGKVRELSAIAQVDTALQWMEIRSRRAESLDTLRKAMRKYPGTEAAAKAKQGLEERIRDTQRTVDYVAGQANGLAERGGIEAFSDLSELLGFYVAESGPPAAADPFRKELKESLTRTAEVARRAGPMSRVFLLTLLADALPDDEAGKQARTEAFAKGVEIMQKMPAHELNAPAQEFPSLTPGMSAIGIENHTPYHLLVFLDGPEQFYVRLNPFSRGSMVLRDGAYDNAVAVAAGEVIPYRGKRTYAGVMRCEGYVIERTGGPPRDEEEQKEVTGDYKLLRVPPGGGAYYVDPDSGAVIGAGGK